MKNDWQYTAYVFHVRQSKPCFMILVPELYKSGVLSQMAALQRDVVSTVAYQTVSAVIRKGVV